jgi:UDPglucose 6-dehydrogenase
MDNKTTMTLAVFGLGHVGLPTALGFADLGWNVIGVESDKIKAESIANGYVPFNEDGVEFLLRTHLRSKKFSVITDTKVAVEQANILFMCVATPSDENGSANISQLENLAFQLRDSISSYKIIIQKSTAPVNTAEKIRNILLEANLKNEIQSNEKLVDVVVIPEFLREGKAVDDFFNPHRIVIGLDDMNLKETIVELYRPLLKKIKKDESSTLVFMDTRSAEISKHAANAFLATKLSFINMISDLCAKVGANVDSVSRAIGMDPRIGADFLQAGIGYGGECLPKDLSAFIESGKDNGINFSMLEEVKKVNEDRVNVFIAKVLNHLDNLQDKTLAVWGLSFKPFTDDLRNSQSIKILHNLVAQKIKLRVYDPYAMDATKKLFKISDSITFAESPMDAAQSSNAILILTEWPQFSEQDFAKVFSVMKTPLIFDGRNMLNFDVLIANGFKYYGMGIG